MSDKSTIIISLSLFAIYVILFISLIIFASSESVTFASKCSAVNGIVAHTRYREICINKGSEINVN